MSQREIDLLQKQIDAIATNTEFKRLRIAQRGFREQQKYKDLSTQLQILLQKKQAMTGTCKTHRNSNGRIVNVALTRPQPVLKAVVENDEIDFEDTEEPLLATTKAAPKTVSKPKPKPKRLPTPPGVVKPVPAKGSKSAGKPKKLDAKYGRHIGPPNTKPKLATETIDELNDLEEL